MSNIDKLIGTQGISTDCFLERADINSGLNYPNEDNEVYRGYPIEFLQDPKFKKMSREERARYFSSMIVRFKSLDDKNAQDTSISLDPKQKVILDERIVTLFGSVVRPQKPDNHTSYDVQGNRLVYVDSEDYFAADKMLVYSDQPNF